MEILVQILYLILLLQRVVVTAQEKVLALVPTEAPVEVEVVLDQAVLVIHPILRQAKVTMAVVDQVMVEAAVVAPMLLVGTLESKAALAAPVEQVQRRP